LVKGISYVIRQFGLSEASIIFQTSFELNCKFQYRKMQKSKRKWKFVELI